MKHSAGILLFRKVKEFPEFFLVHPGGPYWKKKDEGAWSIPKGEFDLDEQPLTAAVREFHEETGVWLPLDNLISLGTSKLKSGKLVYAWACEKDIDESAIISNNFTLEWPPHSKQVRIFPEIDKGEWFSYEAALTKINQGQSLFLKKLFSLLHQ